MKIDWDAIDTVLLDMDGTLLDLHFDNYFWQHWVPVKYAEKHQLSIASAREKLIPRFRELEGTLQWYCVDFWTQDLDLDIATLKADIKHMIRVHTHALEFLDFAQKSRHRVVLVTNAHRKSLDLKMEMTQLQGHFDRLVCSHDLGLPKEHPDFWERLQTVEKFEPERCLLVDDSLPVLRSALRYGIAHLLAVAYPDSKAHKREIDEFVSIENFSEITPRIILS